jgi:hypothetical protein
VVGRSATGRTHRRPGARSGLAAEPGKTNASRATAFAEKHGVLVRIELDALLSVHEERLRDLYLTEFAKWWDEEAVAKAKRFVAVGETGDPAQASVHP